MEAYQSWVEGEKLRFLRDLKESVGVTFQLEGRRESRWAEGPRGTIAVLASQQHEPGPHWWFGLKVEEFRRRGALGVIFLCQTDEGVVEFGLPAPTLERVLPRVSREAKRRDVKLHIFRRNGAYILRPDLDLTPFRGHVSWLRTEPAPAAPAGAPPVTAGTSSVEPEVAFFARVRDMTLEPLDPIDLPDGEMVLVRATVAKSVPGSAALRRIVARGGPRGLPADLAERHDHYRRRPER